MLWMLHFRTNQRLSDHKFACLDHKFACLVERNGVLFDARIKLLISKLMQTVIPAKRTAAVIPTR